MSSAKASKDFFSSHRQANREGALPGVSGPKNVPKLRGRVTMDEWNRCSDPSSIFGSPPRQPNLSFSPHRHLSPPATIATLPLPFTCASSSDSSSDPNKPPSFDSDDLLTARAGPIVPPLQLELKYKPRSLDEISKRRQEVVHRLAVPRGVSDLRRRWRCRHSTVPAMLEDALSVPAIANGFLEEARTSARHQRYLKYVQFCVEWLFLKNALEEDPDVSRQRKRIASIQEHFFSPESSTYLSCIPSHLMHTVSTCWFDDGNDRPADRPRPAFIKKLDLLRKEQTKPKSSSDSQKCNDDESSGSGVNSPPSQELVVIDALREAFNWCAELVFTHVSNYIDVQMRVRMTLKDNPQYGSESRMGQVPMPECPVRARTPRESGLPPRDFASAAPSPRDETPLVAPTASCPVSPRFGEKASQARSLSPTMQLAVYKCTCERCALPEVEQMKQVLASLLEDPSEADSNLRKVIRATLASIDLLASFICFLTEMSSRKGTMLSNFCEEHCTTYNSLLLARDLRQHRKSPSALALSEATLLHDKYLCERSPHYVASFPPSLVETWDLQGTPTLTARNVGFVKTTVANFFDVLNTELTAQLNKSLCSILRPRDLFVWLDLADSFFTHSLSTSPDLLGRAISPGRLSTPTSMSASPEHLSRKPARSSLVGEAQLESMASEPNIRNLFFSFLTRLELGVLLEMYSDLRRFSTGECDDMIATGKALFEKYIATPCKFIPRSVTQEMIGDKDRLLEVLSPLYFSPLLAHLAEQLGMLVFGFRRSVEFQSWEKQLEAGRGTPQEMVLMENLKSIFKVNDELVGIFSDDEEEQSDLVKVGFKMISDSKTSLPTGDKDRKEERNSSVIRRKKKVKKHLKIDTSKVEVLDVIGKGGSCAQVFSVVVDGFQCAMKEVTLDSDATEAELQNLTQEILLHERIPSHPNVVRYLFHDMDKECVRLFTTRFSNTLGAVVQSRKKGGKDGAHRLFPAAQMKKILSDVAKGLSFLHANGIVHRDLKTDNVFVHTGPGDNIILAAIGDFDTSRIGPKSAKLRTVIGTPGFIAPEVLAGDQPYTQSVDVYSYGMIVYELLAFQLPFEGVPLHKVSRLVLSNQLPPLPADLPDEQASFVDVFLRCTKPNPSHRPTSAALPGILASLSVAGDEGTPKQPTATKTGPSFLEQYRDRADRAII
mmetsp:Transcript_36584/g.91725  ORF Transcript_36584/g.91725 Transcript_36584/m.91725 type:complete len:1173 (+) Transcript_36584:43-3561(+)